MDIWKVWLPDYIPFPNASSSTFGAAFSNHNVDIVLHLCWHYVSISHVSSTMIQTWILLHKYYTGLDLLYWKKQWLIVLCDAWCSCECISHVFSKILQIWTVLHKCHIWSSIGDRIGEAILVLLAMVLHTHTINGNHVRRRRVQAHRSQDQEGTRGSHRRRRSR